MDKTKYITRTYNLNPHFVTGFCDAEQQRLRGLIVWMSIVSFFFISSKLYK